MVLEEGSVVYLNYVSVCWSKDETVPGSELWNWPWFQKMEFAIVLKDSSDRRNCPLFPKYVIVKFPWRIVTVPGSERKRRPPSWSMLLPLGSKDGTVHGAETWSWPWSWKPDLSVVPNYVTVNFSADWNCPDSERWSCLSSNCLWSKVSPVLKAETVPVS